MTRRSRGKRQSAPSLGEGANLGRYLKEAFLYRWNMLLFLGGVAASLLSPWPDVLFPLVAAGELTYLTGLTSIPRFRAAIDAQVHQEAKSRIPPRPGKLNRFAR